MVVDGIAVVYVLCPRAHRMTTTINNFNYEINMKYVRALCTIRCRAEPTKPAEPSQLGIGTTTSIEPGQEIMDEGDNGANGAAHTHTRTHKHARPCYGYCLVDVYSHITAATAARCVHCTEICMHPVKDLRMQQQ